MGLSKSKLKPGKGAERKRGRGLSPHALSPDRRSQGSDSAAARREARCRVLAVAKLWAVLTRGRAGRLLDHTAGACVPGSFPQTWRPTPGVFFLLEKADGKVKSSKKKLVIPKIVVTRASQETLLSYNSSAHDEQKTIKEETGWGPYYRHRDPSTVAAYDAHAQE
ncbi:Spermatogenesis-associated protein 33 [Galemys pyrenaicus]|uniref:Spermatogenesis-associated protein 33 n=1 Tax=Galemys pyrenaicus TaxID=202257 RepID=A0A8J6DJ89_GALPY|nr:Spermatogenesis-associated protein 33 [Galemys pyrenaicus]